MHCKLFFIVLFYKESSLGCICNNCRTITFLFVVKLIQIKPTVSIYFLAAAKLILFNARKGMEPTILTLSNYIDAKSGAWAGKVQCQSDFESVMLNRLLLACTTCKGRKSLVPVIISRDLMAVLESLCDSSVREGLGIPTTIKYPFANW
jgi:hypothetical protein